MLNLLLETAAAGIDDGHDRLNTCGRTPSFQGHSDTPLRFFQQLTTVPPARGDGHTSLPYLSCSKVLS